MILAVGLIMLLIDSLLVLSSMENSWLNQKMTAAFLAHHIAFESAEAGLSAQEALINGQSVDLSSIKGQVNDYIASEQIDDCEQHIFTISSSATYQNAQVKLLSTYLQARSPPLPNCTGNQPSHQLEWLQLDS